MNEKYVRPLDYSKVENRIINANADLSKCYDLLYFFGTSVFKAGRRNGAGFVSDDMRITGYHNYMTCGSQLSEDARVFVPAKDGCLLNRRSVSEFSVVNTEKKS